MFHHDKKNKYRQDVALQNTRVVISLNILKHRTLSLIHLVFATCTNNKYTVELYGFGDKKKT